MCACISGISFSFPRQSSPSLYREKVGQSWSVKVDPQALGSRRVSREESELTWNIATAGKKGDWFKVSRQFRSYTGSAPGVYAAAMQAAYRCGKQAEAAKIYHKFRSLPACELNKVVLHLALKIFGKLHNVDMVQQIWKEAADRKWIDKLFAGARIDAAAEVGDIAGAAQILDYMITNTLQTDSIVFNSAINACKNANPPSHSGARYLYDQMLARGLQPCVSTFTNLVRAHTGASLDKIQHVRADMKFRGVPANRMFLESYVAAVFGTGKATPRDESELARELKALGDDRLRELRSVLDEVHSLGVTTKLSKYVLKVLHKVLSGSTEY